jgi:hypothetical protein
MVIRPGHPAPLLTTTTTSGIVSLYNPQSPAGPQIFFNPVSYLGSWLSMCHYISISANSLSHCIFFFSFPPLLTVSAPPPTHKPWQTLVFYFCTKKRHFTTRRRRRTTNPQINHHPTPPSPVLPYLPSINTHAPSSLVPIAYMCIYVACSRLLTNDQATATMHASIIYWVYY